ncbi:equilibrative nucleoside transporter 1-like isoform X1 [Pomacea canaliculata]|uniref:equilibrative nucleoside transporter 1-like isoform X1 n=1 Tax=Pomacea canaliculata TaxID=400727 RepID=UPI000D73EB76|nr:equilibrative nucleoside transporter 1-like isoform X1 [Pomacea canaliculata]XP_025103674.1 equilibrative nucleoside transporter 1-like isoform X1 [Pomacea canaliculata]XP_025103675.1 equilibrative nucleoside transporter 1-like isoform X1 [Pomacea canaliculata]
MSFSERSRTSADGNAEAEVLLPPSTIYAEPKDRWNLVFLIFNFLGIASLLPWNSVTTAKNYFDYKLRNVTLPPNVPYNDPNAATELQRMFESYLSVSAMLSNLVFMFLAVAFVRNISLNVRMVSSLVIIIVIFIFTVVLVAVDSDSWQYEFFVVTLVSSAIMVGMTAVVTGSMFGLSCLFPPKYTRSAMTGQALGGTLTSVTNILALWGGDSPKASAFGYFLSATLISFLALLVYLSLYRLRYSKFYLVNQDSESESGPEKIYKTEPEPEIDDNKILDINEDIPNYTSLVSQRQYFSSILKKVWPYGLTVGLVFYVTLACFPGLTSIIKSVHYQPGDPWTDKYFSPVVCFLMFNFGDLLGRFCTTWVHWPRNGQGALLIIMAVLRVVYIPLLMMCHIDSGSNSYLKNLLNNDAWPIALILTLGLTNGYLGTLSMMYGPSHVAIEQAEGAGMVMTFSMVLGLALGALSSLAIVKYI